MVKDKGEEMDQAGTLRKMSRNSQKGDGPDQEGGKRVKGVAVASGKGGVGKTNIVGNIAYFLCEKGKKVLILDADMGLGNIHILLGLAPRYNLNHILKGERTMREVIMEGPGGIHILPASSGGKGYAELTKEEKLLLSGELENISRDYDYIFFDIGAGISKNVLYFCSVAQDVVIVSSSEPTSFADAYAIMKVLSRDYALKKFKLVVNMVKNEKEGLSIFNKLTRVADRFRLDIAIDYLGHIIKDEEVIQSVKGQRLFSEESPEGEASRCVELIARDIIALETSDPLKWENAFSL